MKRWITSICLAVSLGCAVGPVNTGDMDTVDTETTRETTMDSCMDSTDTEIPETRVVMSGLRSYRLEQKAVLHRYYVTSLQITWRNPPKIMDSGF